MAQNDERNLAKDELYKAVLYYVERQQLVVQAMLDMKLDINAIGKFGALGWAFSGASADGQKLLESFGKEPVSEYERELYAVLIHSEKIRVPQKGVWKDKSGQQWDYFLHGNGCLLVNPETQEPINWDCPNPRAFDDFFFTTHLAWRLKQGDNELRRIEELQSEVISMFSELVKDGLIKECPMPMGLVYTLKEDES